MIMIRGKSPKAVAFDIAEGYVIVNPLFLKPLDTEALKALHAEMLKAQQEIRAEKFPHSDVQAIRRRNVRLSKLHQAAMIVRNFARERRVIII
jgi:hypothetical protein